MGAGPNNSLLNCKVICYQPSSTCEITGAWRRAVRLKLGQTYSLGCRSEVLCQFSPSGHSAMEIYFHFQFKHFDAFISTAVCKSKLCFCD